MEQRKAPASYARQTNVAFELTFAIGGGLGTGAAAVIYIFWPNAPIWAFSAAFGAGFAIFLLLFVRLRPKFKCPKCGKELGRQTMRGTEEGEPIRFVCSKCEIEWESGLNVTRGGD